jgi:hypothetical protein
VLSLSNQPTVDRQFCRSLAAMPDLTHLFLYNVGIDDDDAAELAKCKKLTATTFTKSRLTDVGLARLTAITTLRGTDVSGTKVTGDGVKKLAAALPGCRVTWDGGALQPINSDRGAAEWLLGKGAVFGYNSPAGYRQSLPAKKAELPTGAITLLTFKLSASEFTSDADLARFHELKGLEAVELDGTVVTDAGVEQLATLPALQKLYLNDTKITNAALAHLRGAKLLTALQVGGTAVSDDGLADLKGLGNLRTLDLRKTRVTKKGVEELHAALPACKIESDFGTFRTK